MTNHITAAIEKVGAEFNEKASDLSTRLSELERRAARSSSDHEYAANDNQQLPLAAAIAGSDEIADLSSAFRGKVTLKLQEQNAAITSAPSTVGNNTSAGTSLVPTHRVDGIVTPYERQLRVRDVIGQARTTSNAVEYVREESFTNNANVVSEGAKKPQSDLGFELYTAPVRTIAHTFKISRQMLDDGPALAAYVGRRGTYGLQFVEEQQILFGDGTGQNIEGLIPQASSFAPAFSGTADTAFDRINQAISQAEDAEIPVNAIVMSKRDWRQILGIKDNESRYIADQSPFGMQSHGLWNLPVVATNAMPVGEFVVGAFQDGCQIFDRLDTEVLLSTENEDDFVRNMATIRVESRLAFAVYRPLAFVAGDLYPAVT